MSINSLYLAGTDSLESNQVAVIVKITAKLHAQIMLKMNRLSKLDLGLFGFLQKVNLNFYNFRLKHLQCEMYLPKSIPKIKANDNQPKTCG